MTSILTPPERDELGRLLQVAGSAYDPEGVEALMAGVLAAPTTPMGQSASTSIAMSETRPSQAGIAAASIRNPPPCPEGRLRKGL